MKRLENRYVKSSKLSEPQFRLFAKLFAADLTATQIAAVSGLNRNTVNRLARLLRERMAAWCAAQRPLLGIVEADESYFGPRRVKGLAGRGAGRKTIVFGIFERPAQLPTSIADSVLGGSGARLGHATASEPQAKG